jgi:hypothetical protein
MATERFEGEAAHDADRSPRQCFDRIAQHPDAV